MKTCDAHADAVLDGGAGAPGLEAHLAECARCRALDSAHRSALQLSGLVPSGAARVRRRAVVLRLAAVGAVLAVGLGVALRPAAVRAPEVAVEVAPAAAQTEGSLRAAPPVELAGLRVATDGWAELAELNDFSARTARHNPSAFDGAYAGFQPLASYLVMARQQPLHGLAVKHTSLVSSSEE